MSGCPQSGKCLCIIFRIKSITNELPYIGSFKQRISFHLELSANPRLDTSITWIIVYILWRTFPITDFSGNFPWSPLYRSCLYCWVVPLTFTLQWRMLRRPGFIDDAIYLQWWEWIWQDRKYQTDHTADSGAVPGCHRVGTANTAGLYPYVIYQ